MAAAQPTAGANPAPQTSPAPLTSPTPQTVTFASADGAKTQLTADLFLPAGAGPFPAVVGLHGCNGKLNPRGRLNGLLSDWAARLTGAGYAVLLPDSFRPRGFDSVCTIREGRVGPRVRADDIHGAAAWLASHASVDKQRLAIIGWSHGGSSVLWNVARPTAPAGADYRLAIAFYPGCTRPGERAPVKPRVPLTILMGAADDWTPPEPCQELALRWNSRIVLYEGAYHAFDAPNLPFRQRTGLAYSKNGDGVAHIGTDHKARGAAIAEVMSLLASGLKP